MGKDSLTLLKGTLDVLILKSLHWGPLHGYAVSRWIREVSEDVLEVQEGVLYPALHRLERQGLVQAEWGLSDTNRKVKYYELTASGASRLAAQENDWSRYSHAMDKVLGSTQQPS
jgi:transcriptional regulator